MTVLRSIGKLFFIFGVSLGAGICAADEEMALMLQRYADGELDSPAINPEAEPISDENIQMLQESLDVIVRQTFRKPLLRVSVEYSGIQLRTGEVHLFADKKGGINYIAVVPDKINKSENLCRRRVYSPTYIAQMKPDEFQTVFTSFIPTEHDWIMLGPGTLNKSKGGNFRLRIKNTNGNSFKVSHSGGETTTLSDDEIFDMFVQRDPSTKDWKLYFKDVGDSLHVVNQMDLSLGLSYPVPATLTNVHLSNQADSTTADAGH